MTGQAGGGPNFNSEGVDLDSLFAVINFWRRRASVININAERHMSEDWPLKNSRVTPIKVLANSNQNQQCYMMRVWSLINQYTSKCFTQVVNKALKYILLANSY